MDIVCPIVLYIIKTSIMSNSANEQAYYAKKVTCQRYAYQLTNKKKETNE